MSDWKQIVGYVVAILLVIAISLGCTMYAKRFSYWMWYEDMVKQTVIETLQERGL
jgi:hypothetical protein